MGKRSHLLRRLLPQKQAATKQSQAASKPSPFIIEGMEPRLLLSASVHVSAIQALHDNLLNLEHVMAGAEQTGALAHAVALVSSNGSTTAGGIAQVHNAFDQDVVAALAAELTTLGAGHAPITSTQLASDLQQSIAGTIGTGTGHTVSVTDQSDASNTKLAFAITDTKTQSFDLDLGAVGLHDGMKVADSTGNNLTITYGFNFTAAVSQTLGDSPTATQSEAAFALSAATFDTSLHATANLAGKSFNIGIMQLTVDPSSPVPIDVQVGYHGVVADATGTTLAAQATAITGGDLASLTGVTPAIAVTIPTAGQTDGSTSASPLVSIPLLLTADHVIPGIDPITTAVHLIVTGHEGGTDEAVAVAPLVTALQTATHNPTFDIASLNTFLPGDLATELGQVGNAIDSISGGSGLNIPIPFTSGITVGQVIDVATAFKTLLVDPLSSTIGVLGFTEAQTGTGTIEGSVLTPAQLSHLPGTISMQFQLDNGKVSALNFANTFVDSNKTVQPIVTLANLVTAFNQAITLSPLAGYILASSDNGRLDFTLETPPSGSSPATAAAAVTVSSPRGASLFSNLRDFGVQLATLLRLPGYDDTTDNATVVGNRLLGELGLGYNAASNAVTFSIGHEFDLPSVSAPFSVNLDLGSVANLAISNATFSLTPTVFLNLTVGLSLNPLGSDVNQPGGPVIGDGAHGTTDVALSAIPVVAAALNGGMTPLSADQIAAAAGDAVSTGLPDLQIIGRAGLIKTFEILPAWTLGNLEAAINSAFSANSLVAAYDPVNHDITVTDTFAPYAGPSPASVGLTSGQQASAVQVGTDPTDYQAVLPGTAFTTGNAAQFGQETKFILTIGKLAPVVVDVAAGATDTASFVTALNAALSTVSVDPTQIGLAAGVSLHLSDLVAASADPAGGVALTTSLFDAISHAQGSSPSSSLQRSAAQWGISVNPVDLTITALNGSLLPAVLGLVGHDVNAAGGSQSLIIGAPLDGETLADRLLLENTGVSAAVNMALVPTDSAQPITITGSLGPLGFSAELDPNNVYVSLKVSLLLDDAANAVDNIATLHQLTTALSTASFGSIFALQLDSGHDGQPYARLDIANVHLAAGSVDLASVASPEIIITLDDANALLSQSVPNPHVEVDGFSPSLAAADVISALQQTFGDLDSSLAGTTIPLVDVSLDQILNVATTFLASLDTAQADTAGTLSAIQADINGALGGNYLHLSLDAQHNLIVGLSYTPATVHTSLPFNLNVAQLTDLLGPDAGTLRDLKSTVNDITGSGPGSNLDVTAGVTLALTLGINLGANDQAAQLTDTLSLLNDKKGLRTGASGQNDLMVSLGNGKSFAVDVGALPGNASVQALLTLLNNAAAQQGAANFASYNAATGVLTLTDSTANTASGLAALGMTSPTGGQAPGLYQLSGDTPIAASDAGKAFAFDINIGNGVTAEVDVAADPTRTTAAALVAALQTAIDDTLVKITPLLAENVVLPGQAPSSGPDMSVSLGAIVRASLDSGNHLVLSAKSAVLGVDGQGHLLNVLGVGAATPHSTLSVTSINGSHIAEDLGLGSDAAAVTSAGARSLTGKLAEPNLDSSKLFVKTGDGVNGVPLTGIDATVGIAATNLNFTAGLGPVSGKITHGVATLGLDVGQVAAGEPQFAVGAAGTAPATFKVALNDGFGGAAPGGGVLTFANLGMLGNPNNGLSDLLVVSDDAALSVKLPVQAQGKNLAPIVVQIGNLFDAPEETGLPPRTAHATFPELVGDGTASILNNPQTMIDGLDNFLSFLAGGPFAQQIYGLDLPLIGPALQSIGSFFSTLHNDVIGTLQSLLNSFIAAHPGQPASTLNIVTAGLNDALSLLGIPGEIYSYIDSATDPKEISFVWHFDKTLLSTSVPLSADLGIPGLGLNIQNATANVAVDLNATLGFGYLKGSGFYVYDMGTPGGLAHFVSNNDPTHPYTANFITTHALDLGIHVTLPANFSATLSLGFLTATALNGTTPGTSLNGDLFLDVGPVNPTPRLLLSSFGSQLVVRAYLATQLDIDLMVTAGVGVGGVSSSLPSITTEILFEYAYGKALLGTLPGIIAGGVVVPLTFKDVTLDLGSFLSNFLRPIMDDVEKVIGPLQPILDFLTTPLPGLSQIVGPITVLDLAQEFGGPSVQTAITFIKVADQLSNLATSLNAPGSPGGGMLDFGSYVLGPVPVTHMFDYTWHSLSGGTVDPMASKNAVKNASVTPTTASQKAAFSSEAANKLSQSARNVGPTIAALSGNAGANGKTLLDLPILHDPMAIVEMLMGQLNPVDLIHITLPTFNFSFSKDLPFHFLIGPVPVVVDFYASVGVSINLAFGFDTTGIIRFTSSHNPLDIFDGLYVDDTLGPQLSFHATFGVQAGVDLVLIAAGLGGDITGVINFQLHDPTGTGKIHASLLLHELETNPLQLFDITGALQARIYAWFWVGIDTFIFGKITLYQGQFNILGPLTLLSFSYSYAAAHSTPQLAHQSGDAISLNMGADADQQEVGGNIANDSQTFTLAGQGSGAVQVTANGASTTYSGVNSISSDLGDGNNSVTMTNLPANVTITGGDGNDTVNLAGVTHDPVITLGNGNNIIYGAADDTTITVGNGRNTIYGGTGRMTVYAGSGDNTIIGGSAGDIIVVGSGNNTIQGGAGNDTITASGGANTIWGGGGSNVISIVNGAGNNVIFGSGGPANTTITATQVSDNDTATNDGNNTIQGGNGNDIIFGGNGNNRITGGAGNDIIFGAAGTVQRDLNNVLQHAVASSALGGNNVITAGSGDTIILGGAGSNTIDAGSGNDVVIGNDGTVDGASGGAGGNYSVTAQLHVGGKDVITTGVGTDVVVAGPGANTITGGAGNDIILGHEGTVLRDGPLGRSVNLVSATTTDETAGGNDLIVTGTGTDIVLGGAGSNVIHAGAVSGTAYGGAGLDVLIGGFGTVTATAPGTGAADVFQSLVVTGVDGAAAGHGNNTITTDNTAIIMGGGGNNAITTAENGTAAEIVFGANGQVVADTLLLGGLRLHHAATLAGEEKTGGANVITTGDGTDVVFGGAGNSTVTAGNGSDVILGHLGVYNPDLLATPNRSGAAPDVTGFFLAQDGVALHSTGDTITAGNGADVILGGAGNNRITAGTGTDVVLGAAGVVTRDGTAGNALLVAQTTEESLGGNNVLTVGAAGSAADVVFGGAGRNVITVGNGGNIVLGHLGVVNLAAFTAYSAAQRATGARPDVLGRTLPELGAQVAGEPYPTAGLDHQLAGAGSTIVAGSGNNIIMGGAGNNSVTAGNGNNVVFGASGSVTRDATTKALMFATTVEEQYGGNDQITVGQGNNVAFGGIGNAIITAGDRSNILFGHLGEVNLYVMGQYTALQRAAGTHPDIIGRTLPAIGNSAPASAQGLAGLGVVVAHTTSTIHAGIGANVIMGGAGNNTIVAGAGANVIFGASGSVTRNASNLSLLFAQTVEEPIGGTEIIVAGLRSTVGQIVFGGIGANSIQVGNGSNIVLGHLGVVNIANLNNYATAARDTGALPDIVARILPEIGNLSPITSSGVFRLNVAAVTGNSTILAGNGNNVIMGGGGNNTLNAGGGVNVVFGAAGAVTRDARTRQVMLATTVEESFGGNNLLNVGIGARVGETVFGGAGNNVINVGGGPNVVLGHLGQVDLYAINGIGPTGPDIISRTIPATGNIMPVGAGTFPGLGVPLTTTGDTITAGNGNNIILGGAGNNIISAGTGQNVEFPSSGRVTRNPTTLAVVSTQATVAQALASRAAVPVSSAILPMAQSNLIPASPVPASAANQTYVLDSLTGQWVEDTLAAGNPLLQEHAGTPLLVPPLNPPPIAAAA